MTDRPRPSLRFSYIAIAAAAALLTAVAIAAGSWSGAEANIATFLSGLVCGGLVASALGRKFDDKAPIAVSAASGDDEHFAAMRSIIGELITPAFAIDNENRVQAHNARARELFVNIQNDQSLFQVSRHPALLDTVQRARLHGVTQTGEIAERTAGGRRLLVTVSSLPLRSRDGGQVALLVQFRDLSEQDRLAQSRSDFIANASHELRTPLASLKGFIETLQGSASGDVVAQRRFLSIMEAQASRMARILDDMLSLSRIEMSAHMALTGEVDVSEVVSAAVRGLEPIAHDANVELALEPAPQTFRVRGDKYELEQVLQNLIENAIKYGKPGGRVSVTIARRSALAGQPSRISVAVKDDGPGIAEVHLPRLTERFYRVDTAASRERGGTGLGLAIVKHILNRHRGELLIASVPGQGSTFTVVLDELATPGTYQRANAHI